MKAEDTVIPRPLMESDNAYERRVNQAKISFKAGIKEVIGWLEQYHTPTIRDLNLVQYTICAEVWQSKLKDWGVE